MVAIIIPGCRSLVIIANPLLGCIRPLVPDSIRWVTLVVRKVSMGETKVPLTLTAHDRDQLLLLAATHRALVGVDLPGL